MPITIDVAICLDCKALTPPTGKQPIFCPECGKSMEIKKFIMMVDNASEEQKEVLRGMMMIGYLHGLATDDIEMVKFPQEILEQKVIEILALHRSWAKGETK